MYARGEYVAIKQNEGRRGEEVGIARQRKQISRGGERWRAKWGAGSGRRNKCEGGKAPGRKFRNKATLPRVRPCFGLKFLVACTTGSSLSSLMRSRDNIIPSARQLLLAN